MDKINKIWPKWHTVEPIGRGAFGEVYKIKREEFGETFYSAVKVIGIPNDKQEIQEFINDGQTSGSIRYYYESIVKDLMNEIKVLEELKSAGNVVNIEEFEIQEREEEIGWDVYIRMELLKSLNEYRCGRQMEWEEVEKLGLDICKALEYCERRKIVHRDIKPSNIFVDDYGDFKLGDFGIARQMERTQSMMSQKGTQKYMAPEVWAGNQKSSYNVDIYSLGLVMYQLLNRNRMPFEPLDREYLTYQEKDEAFRKRLRGEEILPPVDAPEGLGKIIVKACEADRNERYQSAHEMYTDLMEWRKEKKESIEKVKKPAPNKSKTEEKINDKKIERVSEEKETEDTVLLARKETMDDLKEGQELIEREGVKEPKHVQEEEQQNHNVCYRLERLTEQYDQLFAVLKDGNQENLTRNVDEIYLMVQYIHNDYTKSVNELCAINSKLDEGANAIEYRELQKQIREYLQNRKYIEDLTKSFKKAYGKYKRKRPFKKHGDAEQLIQWRYEFCKQRQRLESSCLKILDVINQLQCAEMRKRYKLFEEREKILSEIHVVYASPEVMRKRDYFYEEDAVYPFTHEISSNKEEKIQICKKCGSRIPSGRTFCARCGSPIQKDENDDLLINKTYASPGMM